MLDVLFQIFSYDFLVRAMIAGIAIAVSAALIGNILIFRRQSMISDGLSHVAFGATAIAAALSLAPTQFAIPLVILASFIIIRLEQNTKISGDAVIAIMSASALAIGTIVTSVSSINIDLNSYLFGSILSISTADLIITIILSTIIITLFAIFRKQIFAITIDQTFAKSIGINVNLYNTLIAILCSVLVVLGMKTVGALLISSIIIFPAITATKIARSYAINCIASTIIAAIGFIIGFTLSYMLSIPSGASIVITNLVLLLLATLYNKLR